MPFRETSPVAERIALMREFETGVFTVSELCRRHGISRETFCVWHAAGRAGRRAGSRTGATRSRAANEEWSIDFKGWFRTADGTRCDPLTITDQAGRFLVEVRIVEPTWAGVRCALERVFARIGLPAAIRSDNGPPFGSTGAGGLSALSVWWLKLGIEPRYIPPFSPQDNGRHERMHRTLKAETSKPPARSAAEQQQRSDRFRRHCNENRPHEALGQKAPARLPVRLEDAWYDADHEVRRVRPGGQVKWRGVASQAWPRHTRRAEPTAGYSADGRLGVRGPRSAGYARRASLRQASPRPPPHAQPPPRPASPRKGAEETPDAALHSPGVG
jgi:transposase InsO family protein